MVRVMRGGERDRRPARLLVAAAVLGAMVPPVVASGTASAASSGDITSAVLAGRDVTLAGDAVVRVPAGSTVYKGVISGEGTLTVRGSGTLILTRDSDFTLPTDRRRQRVVTTTGPHPYTTVSNPDPPAVVVERGATLQYGTGKGSSGVIGHYPYPTPGYRLNEDNIEVDGTLRLATTGGAVNLGTISGSGLVTQPRFTWGNVDMAGTHSFTGVIENGTGMNFGQPCYPFALPNARAIMNSGSAILDTPMNQTLMLRQNFYERNYGGDVNVHSRGNGLVVLGGVYSYSDQGPDTAPSLSDASLNWRPVPHNVNVRGTNIEAANVQWGDGTTHQIFLPGTAQTIYINLHQRGNRRSRLTFAYNGPVTLGAPIAGGVYHNTLAAPGAGDVVIKSVPGNDVTFAAMQDYDGSTTIERGATLRLGSGTVGRDGGLLMTSSPRIQVIDNGSLVVQNVSTGVRLAKISGTGSFVQSGTATTTLMGAIAYTGPTIVSGGALAVASAGLNTGLNNSSSVQLTRAGATLDLRRAQNTTLKRLSAVKGAVLVLARSSRLTVGADTKALAGLADGTKVTLNGVQFQAGRVAGDAGSIALTSAGSGPSSGPPSPAASAAASATASGAAGTVVKSTPLVQAGGGSAVWPLWAAAVAFGGVATAFGFTRLRRAQRR
jgi:autotransporter-associated beta strand protein